MNPLDINTKMIKDSGISASMNPTDTDASSVGFEKMLSGQINNNKIENSLGENESANSIEEEDNSQPADSKNTASDVLISLALSSHTHHTAADNSNYTIIFAKGSEIESVDTRPSIIKDLTAPDENILKNPIDYMNTTGFLSEKNSSCTDKNSAQITGKNKHIKTIEKAEIPLQSSRLIHSVAPLYSPIEKLTEISTGITTHSAIELNYAGNSSQSIGHINSLPTILVAPPGAQLTTATQTPVQISITVPITNYDWGAQMVEQIKKFALEGISLAMIEVTPKDLGPIVVEIALVQNEAAIHFSVEQQETQQILSQHMSILKESFSQAGMQLQSLTAGSFTDSKGFLFSQQNPNEKKYSTQGGTRGQKTDQIKIEKLTMDTLHARYRSSTTGVDLFA